MSYENTLQLIYRVTYLITLFGAAAIGVFVLSRGWQKPFNRIWAFLQLNVVIWSLGRYMMLVSTDASLALFWSRLSTLGSFFIYPSFLHAMLVILERRNRIVPVLYGVAGLLAVCNGIDMAFHTHLVVDTVKPKLSFRFYDVPARLWLLHLAATTLCPLLAIREVVLAYPRSSRIMQNRLKFLLLAIFVGIIGGTTNVPLVYNIQIEPVGIPLVPIYLFLISYAIYKYRLMEINYFVYRGLSYAFLSLLYVIPSVILFYFFEKTQYGRNNLEGLAVVACLLIIGIVLIPKFKKWTETTIEKTLMKDWLLHEEISRDSVHLITSTIDMNRLCEGIVSLLGGKLDLTSASVYVLAADERSYFLASRYGYAPFPEAVEAHHALVHHLQRVGDVVVKEELEREKEHQAVSEVIAFLDRLDVEVCVPLISKDRLIAVLHLGTKKNGRFYGLGDVELLRNIGGQAAVALENALAVKLIEDLNANLEKKVEERTRELQKALTDLKETQVQLLHSEKMASIGILSAGMTHELYNPLNACLSSLNVLSTSLKKIRAGASSFDEVQDKVGRAVDRIHSGMGRMEKIVTNLKRFSRKDIEGMKLSDIHEGILATIDLVQDQIKEGVQIHTNLQCPELVECNLGEINQVFLNILQNALQALNGRAGNIWISTRLANTSHVEVSFRDDAGGIPADILPHIFDPFFTTKEVGVGTGLGLSVSHRIIHNHGGEIRVQSKPGEGTDFIISLRLRQAGPT